MTKDAIFIDLSLLDDELESIAKPPHLAAFEPIQKIFRRICLWRLSEHSATTQFPYDDLAELVTALHTLTTNAEVSLSNQKYLWRQCILPILQSIKLAYKPIRDLNFDSKFNIYIVEIMSLFVNFKCNYIITNFCDNDDVVPNRQTKKFREDQFKRFQEERSHILPILQLICNNEINTMLMVLLKIKIQHKRTRRHHRNILSRIFCYLLSEKYQHKPNEMISYLRLVLCYKKWKILFVDEKKKLAINEIALKILPAEMPKDNPTEFEISLADLMHMPVENANAGTEYILEAKIPNMDKVIETFFNAYKKYNSVQSLLGYCSEMLVPDQPTKINSINQAEPSGSTQCNTWKTTVGDNGLDTVDLCDSDSENDGNDDKKVSVNKPQTSTSDSISSRTPNVIDSTNPKHDKQSSNELEIVAVGDSDDNESINSDSSKDKVTHCKNSDAESHTNQKPQTVVVPKSCNKTTAQTSKNRSFHSEFCEVSSTTSHTSFNAIENSPALIDVDSTNVTNAPSLQKAREVGSGVLNPILNKEFSRSSSSLKPVQLPSTDQNNDIKKAPQTDLTARSSSAKTDNTSGSKHESSEISSSCSEYMSLGQETNQLSIASQSSAQTVPETNSDISQTSVEETNNFINLGSPAMSYNVDIDFKKSPAPYQDERLLQNANTVFTAVNNVTELHSNCYFSDISDNESIPNTSSSHTTDASNLSPNCSSRFSGNPNILDKSLSMPSQPFTQTSSEKVSNLTQSFEILPVERHTVTPKQSPNYSSRFNSSTDIMDDTISISSQHSTENSPEKVSNLAESFQLVPVELLLEKDPVDLLLQIVEPLFMADSQASGGASTSTHVASLTSKPTAVIVPEKNNYYPQTPVLEINSLNVETPATSNDVTLKQSSAPNQSDLLLQNSKIDLTSNILTELNSYNYFSDISDYKSIPSTSSSHTVTSNYSPNCSSGFNSGTNIMDDPISITSQLSSENSSKNSSNLLPKIEEPFFIENSFAQSNLSTHVTTPQVTEQDELKITIASLEVNSADIINTELYLTSPMNDAHFNSALKRSSVQTDSKDDDCKRIRLSNDNMPPLNANVSDVGKNCPTVDDSKFNCDIVMSDYFLNDNLQKNVINDTASATNNCENVNTIKSDSLPSPYTDPDMGNYEETFKSLISLNMDMERAQNSSSNDASVDYMNTSSIRAINCTEVNDLSDIFPLDFISCDPLSDLTIMDSENLFSEMSDMFDKFTDTPESDMFKFENDVGKEPTIPLTPVKSAYKFDEDDEIKNVINPCSLIKSNPPKKGSNATTVDLSDNGPCLDKDKIFRIFNLDKSSTNIYDRIKQRSNRDASIKPSTDFNY